MDNFYEEIIQNRLFNINYVDKIISTFFGYILMRYERENNSDDLFYQLYLSCYNHLDVFKSVYKFIYEEC